MSQDRATASLMYCRKCGYRLIGLSENRCPECGRPFDPNSPRTFLHRHGSWVRRLWFRRIARLLGTTVLLLALGLASLWAYMYWQYHADWRAEQNAIAALKQAGIDIWPSDPGYRPTGTSASRTTRLPCDPWLAWLTRPLDHLRDRVVYVALDLQGKELTQTDLGSLGAFKCLQEVDLGTIQVTNDQMAGVSICLKDMTQLKTLFYRSHYGGMTDTGLAHLGRLKQLTRLSMWGPEVTDKGLAHLQGLTNLKRLDLSATQIGDDHLDILQSFPAMTYLGLSGAKLSDAGLERLKGLKGLRDLDVRGTAVTRQGIDSLRKAHPGVRILWSQGQQRGSEGE